MFEVLGHSVKIQTSAGRKIILCSCQNSSRFADNNFCYHKQLVLEYISKKQARNKIEEILDRYDSWKNITNNVSITIVMEDLNNIKNML